MIRRTALAVFAIALCSTAAQAQALDVSNGAPYEKMVDLIFANNDPSMNITLYVPPGKRLVVRNVAGIFYGPLGEKYKLIILASNLPTGELPWHNIPVGDESFNDPEANAHATIFNVPTYFNAVARTEGTGDMKFSIVRSAPNLNHATFMKVTISGYLVDLLTRTDQNRDPLPIGQ